MHQYFSLFRGHLSADQAGVSCVEHDGNVHNNSLENNDTLRQIAKVGSDFVTVHRRTGDVDDCSFSTQNFHGLQQGDLLDGGFMERVHIADRPACLGAFSRACHDGGKVHVELRLRCPSPDRASDFFRWIEMTCTAFEADEHDMSGERQVLCVNRDITRWKQREEQLMALEQTAQESIETKTRFLSNMSHELRTPLNAIIGFSEMMKLPGITAQNEQQMVEYAGIIHESGRHLLGVVDEVLDMSQLEAGEYKVNPEIFNLADLVNASVELVQFEAEEKSVRVIIHGLDETLQMNADLRACKLALVELLAGRIKMASVRDKIHLAIKTDEHFIIFVATGSQLHHEKEFCSFSVGRQLQKFVGLLQGSLHVELNDAGQDEVALRLPTGLPSRSTVSNIVSIEHRVDCVSPPLKKTA